MFGARQLLRQAKPVSLASVPLRSSRVLQARAFSDDTHDDFKPKRKAPDNMDDVQDLIAQVRMAQHPINS
jgi:hypothetical protein